MGCHVLFLDFKKFDYDISDEFLAAGYGGKEIVKNFWSSIISLDPSTIDPSSIDPSPIDPSPIDPSPIDPSSVDKSLRDLMITNLKLVNVTDELIIAYNPSSSVCYGDSGNLKLLISINFLIYVEYFLSYILYYSIDLQVAL